MNSVALAKIYESSTALVGRQPLTSPLKVDAPWKSEFMLTTCDGAGTY